MLKSFIAAAAAASAVVGMANAAVVTRATVVESYDASSAIGRGADHSGWMPFFENMAGTPLDERRNGSDFDFLPNGTLTVRSDDTARLTGMLISQVDPTYKFMVSVDFMRRAGPGSGGPKQELPNSSYAANGGPIDPSTWNYFDLTGGSLTGMGSFAGLDLNLEERPRNSVFPMQMGEGANGKNHNLGLAVWFFATAADSCDGHDLCENFAQRYFGGDFNLNLSPNAVPLPAGAVLFLTGVAGVAGMRGRAKAA